MMHGREKSDSAIVAGKPTNKAVPTAAEPVERRAGAKGNASQQSTHRTQRRVRVSQALERVRQVSPSHTQGGSRVREFRSHGSGRGAVSNGRPYRTSMRVLRILTHKRHQRARNSAVQRKGSRRTPRPHACCGVVKNVCCDVSVPRRAVFKLSAAPLPPPKPAIACTS